MHDREYEGTQINQSVVTGQGP